MRLNIVCTSLCTQFVDNQDVLDLIEGKMGVLELLDEQCRWVAVGAKITMSHEPTLHA